MPSRPSRRAISAASRCPHPPGGRTLPDLAFRGAGHYRVRVHHAMRGSQERGDDVRRLPIMAYPGDGDRVVVHRQRPAR